MTAASALGWSHTSIPVAALLLIGMALGPQGLGLVPPNALAFLAPATSLAAAVVGVLLGLVIAARPTSGLNVIAAGIIESVITFAAVFLGWLLIAAWLAPESARPWWHLGLLGGICAAASLRVISSMPDSETQVPRVIEIDALIAIVAGGVVLAFAREATPAASLSLLAQASAVVICLATAGWLLLTKTSSDTEQRVFAVAILLLVGGVAEYLSLSALLAGVVAGAFWQRVGGDTRDSIRRDALFLQHPLLVLLLVVAGARAEPTVETLAVSLAYVVLRAAGKRIGGMTAAYVARPPEGRRLASELLVPGVIGVAFALNALDAAGPPISAAFTVVVLGTVGSDLLAGVSEPRKEAA